MFEPAECPFGPELVALGDGELPAERREAVYRHLEVCAACAEEYRQQERLTQLLRAGDPAECLAPAAVRQLKGNLLQRIAEAERVVQASRIVRSGRRWARWPSFFIVGPALATAVLIVLWARAWHPSGKPPVTVPREAKTQDRSQPQVKEPETSSRLAAKPAQTRKPVRVVNVAPTGSSQLTATGRDGRMRKAAKAAGVTAPAARPPARPLEPVKRLAVEPPRPARERLVIDGAGSSTPPSPRLTSLTLIATGSPDTPEGTVIEVRTYAPEEAP